jgi:subtilisin-like proprotein convertase family protein
MKKKLTFIIIVFSSVFFISYLIKSTTKKNLNQENTVSILREKHATFLKNSPFKKTLKLSKQERKLKGLPPNKYYERMWELTMNPATGKPEPYKVLKLQQNRNKKTKSFSAKNPGDEVSNSWEERGPNNVGGRTRVVFFDPTDTTNNRVYAGGVSGGLWVNNDITNPSSNWTSVAGIPSNMNISCFTIDPKNHETWYFGTGEQYTFGAAVGNGIYKRTNNNGTIVWEQLNVQPIGGPTSGSNFAGIYYINDIVAWKNPNTNSTEIFAGVGTHVYGDAANPTNWLGFQNAGLYKSVNNGTNWSRIETSNLELTSGSSNYTIPNDFEIGSDSTTVWMGTIKTPGTSNGGGKIFKSIDGNNWTLVNTLTNSNRVELAASSNPLRPNKMYALTQGTTSSGPHIFATTDGFSSFIELAKPNDADTGIPTEDFTRGQDFYDLMIEIDPTDDDIVYVGGIDLFRTIHGANTDLANEWEQISKWSNNNNLSGLSCSLVHADQHAFTFRPDANNEAVIGCDGGVYYANSLSTAETNNVISSRNNNYNVTQFYYGAYGSNPSNELILAGAQDNGSQFINGATAGINSSIDVFGGDGAFSEIDQDGDYMIVSYVYNNHYYYDLTGLGSNYYIENGDSEGDFINQADLDHNLNIMYSNGSNKINRYILGSSSATKTQLTNTLLNSSPTAFKISPYTIASTTLLVGTENGKLLKLTNANTANTSLVNWKDITGGSFVGSISDIEFGETENDIFVTFHNYGVSNIWYSSNGGASWVSKEGNLGDFPVKCILQNPLARNEVIIGTELGVWETKNFNENSPTWTSAYNGMRDVKVVDLDIRTSDNSILATTFGRGVFTGEFTNITNPTYTLTSTNSVVEVCKSATNAVFNFDYKALGGYTTSTTISASGIPSGATSNLSATTFSTSNGNFSLTINNIGAVATGEYTITVTGIGGPTVSKDILLIIKDDVTNVTTSLPIDGANQVSINNANLTWNEDSQANLYDVEIATDAGFNTIIETITTENNYYTISSALSLATVYYWKVRAKNDCNTGDYSTIQRFITATLNDCTRPLDENTTSESINDGATTSSSINIADDFAISKLNVSVNISHTYIADFEITLTSPNGTSIILFDGSCGDTDGLEVTFDDDASTIIICGSQPVTGTIIPKELLAGFNGEFSAGNWTIEVYDGFTGDEGTLNSWSLEFCTPQNITDSDFTNSPITVGANSTYNLNPIETNATSNGSTALEQIFMLTELPTKGNVTLNGTELGLGETFTQDDIDDNNLVSYSNTSFITTTDFFKVDITNATSGFLPNQTINITIDATALSVDDQFFEKTGTSVFPTISSGEFSIISKTLLGKTSIEIYTISGQRVFKDQLNITNSTIEKITTNGLASGVYILKLSAESAQGSKKIIIK